MKLLWKRFKERKADKYGSFYEYADRRLSLLWWLLVVITLGALGASLLWDTPGVMPV